MKIDLHRAVLAPVAGAVNVGADVVALGRVLRSTHTRAFPVAGPLWGTVTGAALRAAGQPPLPPEVERWLRHGRAVDTTRMRDELGFAPERTSVEAAKAAVG